MCTQLLVNSRVDDECYPLYIQLIDKCLHHEAFTVKQTKLLQVWRSQVLQRNNGRMLSGKHGDQRQPTHKQTRSVLPIYLNSTYVAMLWFFIHQSASHVTWCCSALLMVNLENSLNTCVDWLVYFSRSNKLVILWWGLICSYELFGHMLFRFYLLSTCHFNYQYCLILS